ncbi:DUF4286 family protein [Mariniflexile litorale]|uniref:DUF4286 family protein n=1 Tax=Mariniflexile litorale TaxID=3045158 RepID=A0AAU7EKC2_9FLAO|nr:DUF4286 family protein [Mariniflexile sp. KMM 9835]MDQ8213287.1 DUF4286 family protein [Mariniflexile sp. KMM 9835]
MYIYNVTSNVDESIHQQWLTWMKEEHIPEVLATGKFEKAILTRVLIEEEMGGFTYAVHYQTPSRETLEAYYNEDAPRLKTEVLKKFADKVLSFRTELEIVDEYTVTFN